MEMKKNHWHPTACIASLTLRAEILANIRAFFTQRKILEVETPLMCRAPVTDPFLEALSLHYDHQTWYLQTSPEYAMKRLLCAGSGSIYQISKAFRADEKGRLHQPEFTLLEWYRIGFNHHDLMAEMDVFLQTILQTEPAEKLSYQQVFEEYLDINPYIMAEKELKAMVKEKCGIDKNDMTLDRDDYLNLLITHSIEPALDKTHPVFIYDFPASQAALAKIRDDNPPVAERFEVYLQGIELANGYHELTDAIRQKERFDQDIEKRKKLNYPLVPIDYYLLSALTHGMPDCAGVALGIDRLVMIAAKKQRVSEIMAFDHDKV